MHARDPDFAKDRRQRGKDRRQQGPEDPVFYASSAAWLAGASEAVCKARSQPPIRRGCPVIQCALPPERQTGRRGG